MFLKVVAYLTGGLEQIKVTGTRNIGDLLKILIKLFTKEISYKSWSSLIDKKNIKVLAEIENKKENLQKFSFDTLFIESLIFF